ncbi:MAG: WD40 repeat domain-containing protein [Rhodobacter sp.]|nr:WD40 repeat domain-containing protein [Rhodobacter sp.]
MKDQRDEREHLQLFDLIARDWTLQSKAAGVVFNNDSTALAFDCSDGTIRLAATADKASPNKRMRRAADSARLTIAPRTAPMGALKSADHTAARSSAVIPHGPSNFAFGTETGRINTVTPGGTSVYLPHRAAGPIVAVTATAQDDGPLAYASGCDVMLFRAGTDSAPETATLAGEVVTLQFSPDGKTLAIGHCSGTSVWTFGADTPGFELDLKSTGLCWSSDGRWLGCCLETAGFALIDVANQSAVTQENFPATVGSIAFGGDGSTVIASGAYRVAAWDLLEPEKNILTGKSGLVLIDTIASCPTRNLVAVGYSNGLVSLAQIGEPGEILLREDTGVGVTALAWSRDGRFLGLAGSDGSAALVEFPDDMFKPGTTY